MNTPGHKEGPARGGSKEVPVPGTRELGQRSHIKGGYVGNRLMYRQAYRKYRHHPKWPRRQSPTPGRWAKGVYK